MTGVVVAMSGALKVVIVVVAVIVVLVLSRGPWIVWRVWRPKAWRDTGVRRMLIGGRE